VAIVQLVKERKVSRSVAQEILKGLNEEGLFIPYIVIEEIQNDED
jgi:ribosomal protein S25